MAYGNRSYRSFTPRRFSSAQYHRPEAAVTEPARELAPIVGSAQQEAIWDCLATDSAHVIVAALAGTGKTTTILHGLRRLPAGTSAAFVAFNKSIATELQSKVPAGVVACTLHSLGLKAITGALGRVQVDQDKTDKMLPANMDRAARNAVAKLVSLCKGNLCDGRDQNELLNLAADYDVDLGKDPRDILQWVPDILRQSRDRVRSIDFDDMVWLPVVLSLPMHRYDVLMVDESQDLNRAQQDLVLMAGERIVLVGDENQAIYGFRGADSDSMANMQARLADTPRGVRVFPLTMTRRCGTDIVEAARALVPTFEAAPNAPSAFVCYGETREGPEMGTCEPERGEMVICRTNAPLIQMAYTLIRNQVPVKIQGRDIGAGLAALIKRLVSTDASTAHLLEKLAAYRTAEEQKIHAANGGERADAKLQNLADKCDCISALCDGLDTVTDVLGRVQVLFSDVAKGDAAGFVWLSSIHKAKGLESDVVHVIHPELLPHPMARTEKARKQEYNLKYVAITRARNVLHVH